MITYAFANTRREAYEEVVAILGYAPEYCRSAVAGSVYMPRIQELEHYYFDTKEEAVAFEEKHNNGMTRAELKVMSFAKAQAKCDLMNQ